RAGAGRARTGGPSGAASAFGDGARARTRGFPRAPRVPPGFQGARRVRNLVAGGSAEAGGRRRAERAAPAWAPAGRAGRGRCPALARAEPAARARGPDSLRGDERGRATARITAPARDRAAAAAATRARSRG